MPGSIANRVLLFTAPYPQKEGRWLFRIWAALLYVGGGLLWGNYFNWGRFPYAFHDWAVISLPRLTFLQDAVRQGALPLHISGISTLDYVTDRFMTVPDVILSPQIILLNWMDVSVFALVHVLLLYSAGFAGLWALCRKKNLSALALTIFFFIFNFNGHLLAHFTVGHLTWAANFLFPWLLVLTFELLDGRGGWDWTLKISLFLFIMLLQGGYHQFIWSLFFLAFVGLASMQHFWAVARAILFAGLLSAARLLPPALNLGKFDNIFIAGYPFFQTIWSTLINTAKPNDITTNLNLTRPIGMWEMTNYIGLAGALFVVGFGLFGTLANRPKAGGRHTALLLPVVGLMVLSLDRVYKYLRIALPLPLLTGERVSSRMLGLALFVLLTLAVIAFQRWLDEQDQKPLMGMGWLGIFILVANDLWQNFRIWRIGDSYEKFEALPFVSTDWYAVAVPDPQYSAVLWVGLVVSLITLAGLIFLARRSAKRPPSAE